MRDSASLPEPGHGRCAGGGNGEVDAVWHESYRKWTEMRTYRSRARYLQDVPALPAASAAHRLPLLLSLCVPECPSFLLLVCSGGILPGAYAGCHIPGGVLFC